MKPFVHVNCAMSADGKIAGPDRKQIAISSPEDMQRAKDLRRKYDAVLVGIGTVLADDPHLTVKGMGREENPVRIVIDPHGRCPDDASVVNDRARTIVITLASCEKKWKDAEALRYEKIVLRDVLDDLYDRGVKSILVEGGGRTIAGFFEEGLVDRYSVFVGSMVIGGMDSPTPVDGCGGMIKLDFENSERLGNGVLLTYAVN